MTTAHHDEHPYNPFLDPLLWFYLALVVFISIDVTTPFIPNTDVFFWGNHFLFSLFPILAITQLRFLTLTGTPLYGRNSWFFGFLFYSSWIYYVFPKSFLTHLIFVVALIFIVRSLLWPRISLLLADLEELEQIDWSDDEWRASEVARNRALYDSDTLYRRWRRTAHRTPLFRALVAAWCLGRSPFAVLELYRQDAEENRRRLELLKQLDHTKSPRREIQP